MQVDTTAGALDVEEYRSLLASAEDLLDGVDRALAHLEQGTYGTCTRCGEPIDARRLEADPTATRCAHHDGSEPGGRPTPDRL